MDKELFVEKYTNYIPKLIDSQITKNLKELLISDNSKWKSSIDSITINEANLKSLDIMLKYKVVNKKTVEKLITMKKLNIDNVNSVLKKY